MRALITVSIIAVVLSGCAGPTIWTKSGNTPDQERKDFAECNFEALKATGSAPSGSITGLGASNAIANDISTGVRRNEIMQACLMAKGYSPQSR